MMGVITSRRRKRLTGPEDENAKPLPEGPPGYPLLGHLHLFRGRAVPNVFQMINDWAKDYGKIYPLKFGPKTMYILNGYDCIDEVFNHPDVDGRSQSHTFAAALGEGKGPASASGKSWSCQRHYAIGFFKKASEYLDQAVADETKIIVQKLTDQSQDSIDIQRDLYRPALYNILTKITFGKRLDYSSEDFKVLVEAMDTVFTQHGPATLYYSLNLPFGSPAEIKRKLSGFKVKCQTEIDNVLGKSSPTYEDRNRLPYLQATVAECARLANVTPLGVPRVATKDVSFQGYRFPTGTTFMSNLHSIMMDPEIFPEPEKLKPERFLDAEGNYHRPKEYTPLGMGMRSCIGEQLAWRELFVITCSVLQKFTLKTPDGHETPSVTTGTTGVARSPLPFRVRVTER
ncbi:putative cytochrome P450 2H2-like isoform X2 [Apostichopus japonicus]|uniref:Putative cytochrome P450 2H2-like isoform X2 n=1 Tax=Stichopus japonicus TaxID=307972 RepID=A0A2G8KNT3_STIJA|nr:putative cytochrome P450 2H2-like isoform X2 [Apostichopus japonicus]